MYGVFVGRKYFAYTNNDDEDTVRYINTSLHERFMVANVGNAQHGNFKTTNAAIINQSKHKF